MAKAFAWALLVLGGLDSTDYVYVLSISAATELGEGSCLGASGSGRSGLNGTMSLSMVFRGQVMDRRDSLSRIGNGSMSFAVLFLHVMLT